MTTAGDWKARPAGPDYEATRQRLVGAAASAVRASGVGALRLDSVADARGAAPVVGVPLLRLQGGPRHRGGGPGLAAARAARDRHPRRRRRPGAVRGRGSGDRADRDGRRPGVHLAARAVGERLGRAYRGDRAHRGDPPTRRADVRGRRARVACCATASHRRSRCSGSRSWPPGSCADPPICGTPTSSPPCCAACSFPSLLDDGARLGLEPRPGQPRRRRTSELGRAPAGGESGSSGRRRDTFIIEKSAVAMTWPLVSATRHSTTMSWAPTFTTVGGRDDDVGARAPEVADVHVGGDERLASRRRSRSPAPPRARRRGPRASRSPRRGGCPSARRTRSARASEPRRWSPPPRVTRTRSRAGRGAGSAIDREPRVAVGRGHDGPGVIVARDRAATGGPG